MLRSLAYPGPDNYTDGVLTDTFESPREKAARAAASELLRAAPPRRTAWFADGPLDSVQTLIQYPIPL